MAHRINNSSMRRLVFDNIDENKTGKIETEETKFGAIFGLKEGDKKIRRKNFNRTIAEEFLNARFAGGKIDYQKKIDGSISISKCLNCKIKEQNIDADIIGNDNNVIVQHGDNHVASSKDSDVKYGSNDPSTNNNDTEEIDLCIGCEVEVTNDEINIEGKGNDLIYQSKNKNIVIENNTDDVHIKNSNTVNIDECENCTYDEIDNHTTIKGDKNDVIAQFGDNNKANLDKK